MKRFLVAIIAAAWLFLAASASAATYTNYFGGYNALSPVNGTSSWKGIRAHIARDTDPWTVQQDDSASAWVGMDSANGNWFIQGGYIKGQAPTQDDICRGPDSVPKVFFVIIEYSPFHRACLTGESVGMSEDHIIKIQRCSTDWCGYVDNVKVADFTCSGTSFICDAPTSLNGNAEVSDEWICSSADSHTCPNGFPNETFDAKYGGAKTGFGTVNVSLSEQGNDCNCATWADMRQSDVTHTNDNPPVWTIQNINLTSPWLIYW